MGTDDPSGSVMVVATAVRCTSGPVTAWPNARPLTSRRTAAASPCGHRDPDPLRRDLGRLNRMAALLEFSVRLVDHELARIDQHHHEHAAREHVVGRDLTLVMR